jgi:hypothetical protein
MAKIQQNCHALLPTNPPPHTPLTNTTSYFIRNNLPYYLIWFLAPEGPPLNVKVSAERSSSLGSFSSDYEYDYEYKIRQAKRMVYAYAIPYWRENFVAVAHLSTKLWRNLVVLTTTYKKTKKVCFFLFSKNNL